KANIADSFCEFSNGELFAINTQIEEYSFGTNYNHKAKSERKLLLNKREMKSLEKSVQTKEMTNLPLQLFIKDIVYAKLDIALGKGKKLYDKRDTIKDRESKINLDRLKKSY